MSNERAWFYNVQEGRPGGQVRHELAALLAQRPLVVAGCEGVGYRLAEWRGYDLIRDLSREGRANLFAYVRRDPQHPLGHPRWEDQEETWGRTQHPGRHAPRSLLTVAVGMLQLVVGHAPPKGTDNTIPAQQEYVEAIAYRMRPRRTTWSTRRPRLALADWNRRPGEPGPGPSWVAREIRGTTLGGRIDCAVVRELEVIGHGYERRVEGVPMESDHGHAFQLSFVLPAKHKA